MSDAPASVLEVVARAVREGKGDQPVEIEGSGLPAIEHALRALWGQPALVEAVEELCLFAVWLGGDRRSPAARDTLLEIARKSIEALNALGQNAKALADDVRTAASEKNYSRFTGRIEARAKANGVAGPGAVAAGPLARFALQSKDPKKPTD